jgi:hypothetical protein
LDAGRPAPAGADPDRGAGLRGADFGSERRTGLSSAGCASGFGAGVAGGAISPLVARLMAFFIVRRRIGRPGSSGGGSYD